MLIIDENQIRLFFDTILPAEWEEYEAAFISLAARRKYLPEGKEMDLGDRPDMLDRDIVKHHDFSEYLSKLYRFTQPEGYRDSNGRTIPQEAMAVYVNLHLSDSIGAWRKTKEQLARIDSEIASKAFTGSADLNHIYHNMRNLAGIWYTQMQNTYSRKLWIDYDIDLIDTGLKEKTAGNVRKLFSSLNLAQPPIIATRGGLHVLLSTTENTFSRQCNPQTILQELIAAFGSTSKEIVINPNGMLPLPGTLQGNVPVYMTLT